MSKGESETAKTARQKFGQIGQYGQNGQGKITPDKDTVLNRKYDVPPTERGKRARKACRGKRG